ncbi:hypothetical protein L1049_007479 [Liquidambar formosana]|uniref:Uncharacterized protein n=1 Tax=Liquidambar formosana TaxID=63359 RepID=A0AAP0S908_LIQFO
MTKRKREEEEESKMGQTINKLTSGSEEKKAKEIDPIIESCYNKHFAGTHGHKEWNSADFYRAVSETVEELNKKLGHTQFRVPKAWTIEQAYKNHYESKEKPLSEKDFQKILQDMIVDTGFTGIGAKDLLFFIFGIPMTALLVKQRVAPKVIPNEIFIPGVTSATVFLLAKLNKI